MQNKLVALELLLVALLIILFVVKRKKVKKNKLEVPKTKTEITENFKKLVGDIDLNLGNNDLSEEALIEVEETLLALKELYEKKYISEEVYLNRTEMIMQSLNKTNAP
jgi:hypothetical protein